MPDLEFGCAFAPDLQCKYDMAKGYGYSDSTVPSKNEDLEDSWPGDYYIPAVPSLLIDVPKGNYRVTLTLGAPDREAVTTVKEGLGHLRLYEWRTGAGERVTKTFDVHVNDGQLKLAFGGAAPAVHYVEVKRMASIATVFLAGDSTVTDQPSGQFPYTGWGQMLGVFLNSGVALDNHARSGRSSKSFINENRLIRIAKKLRKGDCLLVQFAHNDEKDNEGGTQPFTSYQAYLQRYIDLAREKEAYPVLIAPMHRRFFEQDGTIRNTHGDYIEAMRQLAEREKVPFVDLAALSKAYYEELGGERTKEVLLWAKPGQYPCLPEGAEDNTHFSERGAAEIARLVAKGLMEARVEPLWQHVHTGEETGAAKAFI
ncbi:rhamnogalacturonan acetylesterase [Paenibacillus tengchongensis]|uniref:rhamnogalacturonan acetylesterase n=1 Tax=Paenibacillus tengchongensis TaxID=2608684 RepID=UPI001651DE95|nr:rhamnogalacturonan acetylesterase [Paenibacillus tengchongensis]